MVTAATQPHIFEITGLVAREHSHGKIALPVDRAVLLYSRYEHVRGTFPVGDSEGVPLSKLRALDNLIERLLRLQGRQPIVRNTRDLTKGEVDDLIAVYRKDLHRTATAPTKAASAGSPTNDVALTLNIVA
jgi:hypothetical protein